MTHHVPVKMQQVIALVRMVANVMGHHAAERLVNLQIAKKPVVIIAQERQETMSASVNPDAK